MATSDDARIAQAAIGDLAVPFADAVTRGDRDGFEALWTPDGAREESEPFPNCYEGARSIRERVAASRANVLNAHGDLLELLPPPHVRLRLGLDPRLPGLTRARYGLQGLRRLAGSHEGAVRSGA